MKMTKGQEKVKKFLLRKMKSKKFQLDCQKIRDEFGIPSGAIDANRQKNAKAWDYNTLLNDDEQIRELQWRIYELMLRHNLFRFDVRANMNDSASHGLMDSVTLTVISGKPVIEFINMGDTCAVSTVELLSAERTDDTTLQDVMIRTTHPITINISPFATRNEILDFVEKRYKSHIEPLQKKRSTQNQIQIFDLQMAGCDVNEDVKRIIKENMALPIAKLRRLIADQDIVLDDAQIKATKARIRKG